MKILLGTLAYMIVTFPYAIIWHMKLFHKQYLKWNYFGGNPNIMIGLLTIVIQGALLTFMYDYLVAHLKLSIHPMSYALVIGLFFWTSHVLAAMAKHEKLRHVRYLLLETLYLFGQFATYGLLIGYIY